MSRCLTRTALAAVVLSSVAAFASAQAPEPPGRTEAVPVAQADEASPSATANLRFLRETAEVGEPVELLVEVTHDPRTPFLWGRLQPELDPSWVLFDSRPDWSTKDAQGRAVSRHVYRIASLEPGPRRAPEAFREALEGTGTVLYGLEPILDVGGLLAESEDAPRPLRGYPEGFGVDGAGETDAQGRGPLLTVLVGGFLAVGVAVWLALRAGKRRPRVAPEPTPRERLATLLAADAASRQTGGSPSPEALAQQVYAVSHVVRDAADRRLGAERPGLTDEEWLAAVTTDVRLDGNLRGELETLFARFQEVKYAGVRPSSWAMDETFDVASRVVEGLASAPEARPQAPSGEALAEVPS